MFYSKYPPADYEKNAALFFANDEARWNLMWLFFPRMDLLNDMDNRLRVGETTTPLSQWIDRFDTDLSAACTVDLERTQYRLREHVTTLAPVAFMDWLWKQPYQELLIFQHVGLEGMRLASKRAQWLDQTAENPPSALVITPDFTRRG